MASSRKERLPDTRMEEGKGKKMMKKKMKMKGKKRGKMMKDY